MERDVKRTGWKAALALAAALVATSAVAQQPGMVRVRGTIEKVDGQTLSVKSRDGSMLTVKLADKARVTAMVKASLADIKVGTFVGVTAMPQPDGSQKAVGLHIFMDAQKGVVPERFSQWDRQPGSTMTNADVTSTVSSVDGQVMMVKYADGEKKIIVPPDTPVVKFVPGSMSDLKAGAQIFIVAAKKMPDGTLEAPGINVGRDGVAPPM
jgi:hypothetical protein